MSALLGLAQSVRMATHALEERLTVLRLANLEDPPRCGGGERFRVVRPCVLNNGHEQNWWEKI